MSHRGVNRLMPHPVLRNTAVDIFFSARFTLVTKEAPAFPETSVPVVRLHAMKSCVGGSRRISPLIHNHVSLFFWLKKCLILLTCMKMNLYTGDKIDPFILFIGTQNPT